MVVAIILANVLNYALKACKHLAGFLLTSTLSGLLKKSVYLKAALCQKVLVLNVTV